MGLGLIVWGQGHLAGTDVLPLGRVLEQCANRNAQITVCERLIVVKISVSAANRVVTSKVWD
jgi:hypothetical protein